LIAELRGVDKESLSKKFNFSRAEVGEFYDELPLWSAPFGLLMLERVPLRNGLRILDVGAGTGFMSIELAQRCGPGSAVYAVDPWRAGLDRLRRKIDYLKLDNVHVIEGDAAKLDLPDSSIDLVVSNLGVNNFENADAVLAKCHRVLSPGGQIILTSNLVGHMREFYHVYRQTLIDLGILALPTLETHIHHRATVDSLGKQLRRAGFEVTAVTERSLPMRFADGTSLLSHYFIRLGFIEEWAKIVSPDDVERTFAALEKNLNDYAASRGELVLTIPMACLEAKKAGLA
jgi:ubiquinone/menaquinone biosynthesis C-methylase UbiE